MTVATKNDRLLLLSTATEIVRRLRGHAAGTSLRIRRSHKTHSTDTGGWAVALGNLGAKQPVIELWFDRFSAYPARKFWVGFFSNDAKAIDAVVKSIAKELWPIREITESDTNDSGTALVLARRIRKNEFNAPVLEHYRRWSKHYFGFYDPTQETRTTVSPKFCERAVGFLLDVGKAAELPPEAPPDDYPRCENRKLVMAHLGRERSKYLAAECKIRDGYQCQVCGMTFAEVYGETFGDDFAEAHHIEPLANLPDYVTTRLEDLVTVCANCHRMLHRMDGKADDVKKLRALVRRHRGEQT